MSTAYLAIGTIASPIPDYRACAAVRFRQTKSPDYGRIFAEQWIALERCPLAEAWLLLALLVVHNKALAYRNISDTVHDYEIKQGVGRRMMFPSVRRHLWLTALFLMAVPVFYWQQWQPQAWFEEQVAASGLRNSLSYTLLNKSFPELSLSNASITLPNGKNIAYRTILVRPSLVALLKGSPALFARAETADMQVEAVIAQHDTQFKLSDVVIHADAAKLSRFDSRLLLLGLQGKMALRGHIQLNATDGLPLNGDTHLVWSKPSSILLPPGMDNIRLTLASSDSQETKIWTWKVISQPKIIVGQGTIMEGGPDIRQWLLHGTLRTAKDRPELVLSGTLGAPHWQ